MEEIGRRNPAGNQAIPQREGFPSGMEAWHLRIGQEKATEERVCEFGFGGQEGPYRLPPAAR